MNSTTSHHTLSSYDKQLSQLTESILSMGALVKELVFIAKRSLFERDPTLVNTALATDVRINELDREIEHQATIVLALQNPMAVDLRFVTSALKIAGMLERAGDLAKNTTKRSMKLEGYSPTKVLDKFNAMVDIVVEMLDDALQSVALRDAGKATAVWSRDDQVDSMYHEILTTMQQEMLADPAHILPCTHFVFAAKNFERVADYATNIAKAVHYVTSGKPADKHSMRAAADEASGNAAH